MQDPLHTHTYDGKLVTDPVMCARLTIASSLSLAEKQRRGLELLTIAQTGTDSCMTVCAISFLQRMIVAMGTPANVDPLNKLLVDDLICLCWEYRDNAAFMKELEIQLMDMATGFCVQGRTCRLYQILKSFIN